MKFTSTVTALIVTSAALALPFFPPTPAAVRRQLPSGFPGFPEPPFPFPEPSGSPEPSFPEPPFPGPPVPTPAAVRRQFPGFPEPPFPFPEPSGFPEPPVPTPAAVRRQFPRGSLNHLSHSRNLQDFLSLQSLLLPLSAVSYPRGSLDSLNHLSHSRHLLDPQSLPSRSLRPQLPLPHRQHRRTLLPDLVLFSRV
ncbi:hypothetical protein BGW36DRAFT_213184 [Talaromyces proteolyticus]|uniref:Uncharacterized protein n=1 Tax=Talaromyces proteolyticus TaxID=1131652 RepID=A0AAD4KRF0_9EURO|nr:uncharacterized protein BGW36DRAFT_213184 [Talaromyces proteolyticus]KAH8693947.1 hypothetical protein BGW36DRAFT_213184 [Talaromyces proteolyticus]